MTAVGATVLYATCSCSQPVHAAPGQRSCVWCGDPLIPDETQVRRCRTCGEWVLPPEQARCGVCQASTQPRLTVKDAAARTLVRLPDGRTGKLLSVPARSGRPSNGRKARVQLPGGPILSVEPDLLERASTT